jgi:hypothetical protein
MRLLGRPAQVAARYQRISRQWHMPAGVRHLALALPARRARGTLTAFPLVSAYFVLVITSALLLLAAWTDFREYKICNELVLALVGLFSLYAFLTGHWGPAKMGYLVRRFDVRGHAGILQSGLDGWRRCENPRRRLSLDRFVRRFAIGHSACGIFWHPRHRCQAGLGQKSTHR